MATPSSQDDIELSRHAFHVLDQFVGATDATGRLDALVRLVWAVRVDRERERRIETERIVAALDQPGELRDRFGAALASLLSETDCTNLFGCAGIPGYRGFFSEFGIRLAAHMLPAPRDERDLRELFGQIYGSDADIERARTMPPDLFRRLAEVFRTAPPAGSWAGFQAAFADGFRLLLSRVASEGFSPKLRARGSGIPVATSPFNRAVVTGQAVLPRWLAGADPTAEVAAFREAAEACRRETEVIRQRLEGAGVSVDIVFSLEVIDRCLARSGLMVDAIEAQSGPEWPKAAGSLLVEVLQSAHRDRSLRDLVSWNLHLLSRKIIERSSETGEHYIAKDRQEYRHIWTAAAGGGALTVGTAVVKTIIHGWHLAPLPEGLLYGLNYAMSFLALQHLGLILATKQPAMTAARFAEIIRDNRGEDREERIADTAARLTSSQLAAAAGNVLVVGTGAALFAWLFARVFGAPFQAPEAARDTLIAMGPLSSGTIWYAALTGVVLWLASLAGGWFDNWCVYNRIPEGFAQLRTGSARVRTGLRRIGGGLARHAAGWGTNVSLGFMLGFMPEIGRITALPVDVRHVTLNTGVVALAAAGAGPGEETMAGLTWAALGIGAMFILNLSVSFACSLYSAAGAFELSRSELTHLLRGVGRRLVQAPLQFITGPGARG